MPPELTAEETSALKDKKILILEDDPLLQNLLVGKLSKYHEIGLKTFPAFNADRAFELLRTENPDLILLDIMLAGKNGIEFLEELRKDPAFEKTPVIVLSNLNEDENKTHAQALGILKYFVKANFSLEEIGKEIAKVFAK